MMRDFLWHSILGRRARMDSLRAASADSATRDASVRSARLRSRTSRSASAARRRAVATARSSWTRGVASATTAEREEGEEEGEVEGEEDVSGGFGSAIAGARSGAGSGSARGSARGVPRYFRICLFTCERDEGGGGGGGGEVSERERRARGVGDGRVVTFAARRRRSGRSSREAVGLARVAHQPTPEVRLDEQRRALLGHAYATPERGRSAVPHGERDVPEGHVERTDDDQTG